MDLQYIKDFLLDTEAQQIRILFFGPVGVGKSSFINTVQSALQGRMYTQAGVDNTASTSYTKKVEGTFIPPFLHSSLSFLPNTLRTRLMALCFIAVPQKQLLKAS